MRLIVVGVDGNPPAQEAARRGAELARATGATLHVVCAYAKDQVADLGDAKVSIAEESAKIAATAGAALGLPGEQVTSIAVLGKPAEVLISEAERLGADLIVVGNKRVQGVARALGSIAGHVAQRAECDVFVAHTH